PERSERRKPNCSASLRNAEENSSERNENSIFENVCIGEWSPEVVELETMRSKRKSLNPQTAKELGEPFGSASASFGEINKSKPIGYMAQQIRLPFSDEESPLYGNIPIGEV
ncbi:hypothetical protein NPIL_494141, partial [Nephila pilipes]